MIRSRSKKSVFVILTLLVTIVACSPLATQIPTSTDTPTVSDSLTTPRSFSATRTSIPTQVPTDTQLPSLNVTMTQTLEHSITRTPTSTATCPATNTGVTPIEVHHPSKDYSEKIINYLNSGGGIENLEQMLAQLEFDEDNIIWQAQTHFNVADVTGDTAPDVVLDLLFFAEDNPVLGSGYVFYCKDGQYEGGVVINLSFSSYFSNDTLNNTIGLRALHDMNSNGIPEIIFSFIPIDDGILSIDPSTDYARWFQIIEWDGAEFSDLLLDSDYGSNALSVVNGDGKFTDMDGNNYLEFILEGGSLKEEGHGHRFFRASTETWEWFGYELTLKCKTFTPPIYRFQAVEDGDAAFLCQDYAKALASYQRAIFDESLAAWSQEFQFMLPGEPITGSTPIPDPEELPLLSAYAQYRILLIHLIDENYNAASTVYEILISNFPDTIVGHQYVELAMVVWNEYMQSEDLSAACRKANELADSRDDLVPISRRYTYYSILYSPPNQLCPFDR